MNAQDTAIFSLLGVLSYLVAPLTLVWGWLRFFKNYVHRRTIGANLSLIGQLFASLSAVLAVVTAAMAATDSFHSNYQHFYQFVRDGGILSLVGILFSLAGIWKRSSLRWHAPVAATATLAFWILATTWP